MFFDGYRYFWKGIFRDENVTTDKISAFYYECLSLPIFQFIFSRLFLLKLILPKGNIFISSNNGNTASLKLSVLYFINEIL